MYTFYTLVLSDSTIPEIKNLQMTIEMHKRTYHGMFITHVHVYACINVKWVGPMFSRKMTKACSVSYYIVIKMEKKCRQNDNDEIHIYMSMTKGIIRKLRFIRVSITFRRVSIAPAGIQPLPALTSPNQP